MTLEKKVETLERIVRALVDVQSNLHAGYDSVASDFLDEACALLDILDADAAKAKR